MFEITPLSQNDPAWAAKPIGTSSQTIGRYGCLLTCITMVVNGFGQNETPASLNDKMVASRQFVGSDIIPSRIPKVLPGILFKDFRRYMGSYAPMGKIDAALMDGKPVIVELDHSPSPGLQRHWVILTAKVGEDYTILDPWPYPSDVGQVFLKQRYGFAGDPAEIIIGAIWMDCVAKLKAHG